MNLQLINWMGKAYPARIVKVPDFEDHYKELLIVTIDFQRALNDMDVPALDAIMWKTRIHCAVESDSIFLSDNELLKLIKI